MIRRAETRADFELCCDIFNVVEPERRVAVEDVMTPDQTGVFLVHGDDGYVYVNRSSLGGSAFTPVRVRPERRRRGVGSALLAAAAEEARGLGVSAIWGRVEPDDDESMRFLTKRGFEEFGRDVMLLRELAADEGPVPDGIVELRDEHLAGAYAVAVECTPDMAIDPPPQARPFEEWRREELSGPVTFVALDGGLVVGYAALLELKATPHRLEHALTAVLRSHRGRGLAQKLKQAQIAWASAHGYRELVTYTQEGNEPMRAVNTKLGYVESPSSISVRAPLPPPAAAGASR